MMTQRGKLVEQETNGEISAASSQSLFKTVANHAKLAPKGKNPHIGELVRKAGDIGEGKITAKITK